MMRRPQYATREPFREPVTPRFRSDPPDTGLEMKFSDDSSVFSGLVDQENEMNHANNLRQPTERRQPKGILRKSRRAGPQYVVIANNSQEGSGVFSQSGSSLTERSNRSAMREMRPMVDEEFNSGDSAISADSYCIRDANSNHDGESNTQMTWTEVNDTIRPAGSVKLVSSVRFLGDNIDEDEEKKDFHYIKKSGSSDSDSRIVELLDDFERQMDANIQSLSEDSDEDENNVLTDFNKNILSENTEIESQGPQLGQFLAPQKAKRLQRILQKARKDVEVLRDNNEQYKSELEQMEEEHKSEIKLVEDRAKHKLVELKNMYQNEIDLLVQEKDAAVVEAGRVAARYAENGKMQVVKLQKQIEKLKAAAAITVREKIKEERELTTTNKDKEIAEKVELLQESHKVELEKLKEESDERLKLEVEKAASSVAKRVRLNQDVLISELTTQIDDFRKQRHSILEVLESVKTKFTKHYPDQMKDFNEKPSGDIEKQSSADRGVEKPLMEVIEIFSYLLEGAVAKAALAKEKSEIEEKNQESRKLLALEHRAEIEKLKNEIEEKDEKMRKIEEDFKALSREECLLREKYERESESHKLELERMSAQKETFISIERSRKDLQHAMVEGQKELSHAIERTEYGQFATSSQLYLPSISSPMGTSAIGEQIVISDDQRRPIDMPQSPGTVEPSSIEKARNFQKRHPNRLPRYASRDSPRYRLSGNFGSKQVKESPDGRNRMPTSSIYNPGKTDSRSVVSNSSIQSDGTLSTLRNHVREAEDEVIDIMNSMSDSTSRSVVSVDKSTRSKDTILSNFRNQPQKPRTTDTIEPKEQKDLEEEKDYSEISTEESRERPSKVESDNIPRRERLALALSRRNTQTSRNNHTSPQEIDEEVEVKKENTDVLRRARMFKQFMEQNRQDEYSLESRKSLESISSLQTNNGAMNKGLGILDSGEYESFTDTRDDCDEIVKNNSHESSTSRERGTNTLGMFARGKKQQFKNDVEQDSTTSEFVSEVESKTVTQSQVTQPLQSANERMEQNLTFEFEKGASFRDSSTHLNFKKPPPSFDTSNKSNDLSGRKDNVVTEVFNGKRVGFPSDVPIRPRTSTKIDSIDSEADNSIPSSIAVRPPSSKNITAVANGHTLLCKPLPVHQSKIHPQQTVSNLSGGTFSSNEDDELVYESHAQMRKLPPLTDDSEDEESGEGEQDKYQSVGSKTGDQNISRAKQKRTTTVATKKSTYRRLGLAAFKPSKSYESSSTRNTSDTSSATGSSASDATTTITAHTRKSIFQLSPRRSKTNTTKYGLPSSNKGIGNGSKRFAALKARVRVRKV